VAFTGRVRLIEREAAASRNALTEQGRAVLAALRDKSRGSSMIRPRRLTHPRGSFGFDKRRAISYPLIALCFGRNLKHLSDETEASRKERVMQTYSDFFKTLHDETSPTGHLGRGTHYSVLRAVVFHDPMGNALSEGQFADFAVIWDEDHDTRVMEPIEKLYLKGLLASFIMFGERKGTFTASVPSDFPAVAVPFSPAFLRKIEELELSNRTSLSLRNDDVVYIAELVQKSEADLLRTPNFGRKCLVEIKEMLAQMGLQLDMEVPGWRRENANKLVNDLARIECLETEIRAICQSLNDPWPSEVVPLGSQRNRIIDDEIERVNLYLKNLDMLWQLGTRVSQPKETAAIVTAPARRFVVPKRPAVNADGTLPGWTTNPSEADRDLAFE
jgi:hypothetical protein